MFAFFLNIRLGNELIGKERATLTYNSSWATNSHQKERLNMEVRDQ